MSGHFRRLRLFAVLSAAACTCTTRPEPPPDVSASLSTLAVSTATPLADGATPVTVTVHVKDSAGAAMAGRTVALSYTGVASITPGTATTDLAGKAEFTMLASSPTSGVVRATVTPSGTQLSSSPEIRFQQAFGLSASIRGLTGTGLRLSLDGQAPISASVGATAITFPGKRGAGASYVITVAQQPTDPPQVCEVAGGSGSVAGDVVATVDCWSAWTTISTGWRHSLGLRADGSLWAWGQNDIGELGIGVFEDRSSPVRVGSASNWTFVNAGGRFSESSMAIQANGTLWIWGQSDLGALSAPVQVGQGTRWKQASRNLFSGTGWISIAEDGTLWSAATDMDLPTPMDAPGPWASFSEGEAHWALKVDGSLWSPYSTPPTQAGADTDWAAVFSDGSNNLGLKQDGTLWEIAIYPGPTPMDLGAGWASVSIGSSHFVGLKTDGSAWTWGGNSYGELATGAMDPSSTPTRVGTGERWKLVSAGSYHTILVAENGKALAAGRNTNGQLGNGASARSFVPLQVAPATGWESVSTSGVHSLATRTDGTLWAWGENSNGELGLPSVALTNVPVQVGTADTWREVATTYGYSVALTNDGRLWEWGALIPAPRQVGVEQTWVTVAAGYAIKGDHSLWAWQPGAAPTQVGTELSWQAVWTAATTPTEGAFARKLDGTLWDLNAGTQVSGPVGGWRSVAPGGWVIPLLGVGADGMLWQFTGGVSSVFDAATTWTSVSSSGWHSVALKADGSLWTWGNGYWGALGLGDALERTVPTQLGVDKNWTSVAAGGNVSFARKRTGALWAWGEGDQGQLGCGIPVANPSLVNVR